MPPTADPAHDLYRRLQRHLDTMPVPFPAAESGADLRILQRLFSETEARVVLCLGTLPERLGVIHRRFGRRRIERDTLRRMLDDLARRGLVQRMRAPSWPFGSRRRSSLYGKTQFVVGFYEAQVNRLTPELQSDVEAYGREAFGEALHATRVPQLRTVPINQPIAFERAVGCYDDIRAFVRTSAGPFAVMNCICQQGKDLLGEPCRQTTHREHCLTIGAAARSMVRSGDARFISQEEMLALLEQAEREGLVVQPQNTQSPLFICCCCGCCCGVLTTAKRRPQPSASFANNFVAVVSGDDCHACAACVLRCQMEAISVDAGPARIALDRCIGCGLCISTCPSGALRMLPKGATAIPPKDTARLYLRIFRERFGWAGVAKTLARRVLGLRT